MDPRIIAQRSRMFGVREIRSQQKTSSSKTSRNSYLQLLENLSQHILALPIQQTDMTCVSKLKISRLGYPKLFIFPKTKNDTEECKLVSAEKMNPVTYNFSSVVVVDHVKKGIRLGDLLDRADVLEAQTVIEQ